MKPLHVLTVPLLGVFLCGCGGGTICYENPVEPEYTYYLTLEPHEGFAQVQCGAGTYGIYWDWLAVPTGYNPAPPIEQFKYSKTGEGEIFWVPKDGDPLTWVPEPIDTSVFYPASKSDTHFKIFRPPPTVDNSLYHESYTKIGIAEIPRPWEWALGEPPEPRSVSYRTRFDPIEFGTYVPDRYTPPYRTMKRATYGSVTREWPFVGELRTFPLPYPVEDLQLQYHLSGPDGYSGDLGELTVRPHSFTGPCTYFPNSREPHNHSLLFTGSWDFVYTAPKDLGRSLEIKATFSIYDPWLKIRRELPFTFQVSSY
jgi:hypothetical protein